LDNYIGIDESAEVIFEKCMKIPDGLLADYFRLTTDMPEEEYITVVNEDIRKGHMVYARKIIEMYHGKEFIKPAEDRYVSIASNAIPDNINVLHIDVEEIGIIDILTRTGLATSNSEARRLILGGGIKVDGITVYDINLRLKNIFIISRGKNRFIKVKMKEL
jgi:tyrosyl-tRNA synthetase